MKSRILMFIFMLPFWMCHSQVSRQMVLLEIVTNTGCSFCPGASMGANDLLSNGWDVAVVKNHYADAFSNVYSQARKTMYQISGTPTAIFDGYRAFVGGSYSSSLYLPYLGIYNQCIPVPSPVTIQMEVSNDGLNYSVLLTVKKVAQFTSDNLVFYFFLTQSNIMFNWMGQTHVENVNRMMVPDQNGTPVNFSSGTTQEITLNFTLNAAWPAGDCELIATVQDKSDGQGYIPGTNPPIKKWTVFQTIKRGLVDLTADFTVSDSLIIPGTTVQFTNLTTGGYQNVPETYLWVFQGGVPDYSTQENPQVNYPGEGHFPVKLIVNRGGQVDTVLKEAYIKVGFENGGTINGLLTYDNVLSGAMKEVGVLLMLDQAVLQNTLTDQSGNFVFYNIPDGDYTIAFDCEKPWGGVNAGDALLILKHFVHLTTLTGLRLAAADADDNGIINTTDALYVSKRYVELISGFPAGDWLFSDEGGINIQSGNTVEYTGKAICVGDTDGSYQPE